MIERYVDLDERWLFDLAKDPEGRKPTVTRQTYKWGGVLLRRDDPPSSPPGGPPKGVHQNYTLLQIEIYLKQQ